MQDLEALDDASYTASQSSCTFEHFDDLSDEIALHILQLYMENEIKLDMLEYPHTRSESLGHRVAALRCLSKKWARVLDDDVVSSQHLIVTIHICTIIQQHQSHCTISTTITIPFFTFV